MDAKKFIDILGRAGKLKTNTRHCWTEGERKESVADHSYRMTLMAMLLTGEADFADIDINKVIRMCLIHDLGEAFTGDIPTFEKTEGDTAKEDRIFDDWVANFDSPQREEWQALLREMNAQETEEAKLYKALDKLEAILSHDESDVHTWLPLEHELQLSYGKEEILHFPALQEVRLLIDAWTRRKLTEEL